MQNKYFIHIFFIVIVSAAVIIIIINMIIIATSIIICIKNWEREERHLNRDAVSYDVF